jgi:hypothetical protein
MTDFTRRDLLIGCSTILAAAPGPEGSERVREHRSRQGMMGEIKVHYDCVKAFSETDFTEDQQMQKPPDRGRAA